MPKQRLKKLFVFLYTSSIIFLVIGFSFSFVLSSSENMTSIYNDNLDFKVSSSGLYSLYEKINNGLVSPVFFDSFADAVEYSMYYPTSFSGKLTHYGPDCALCGGFLGCNGQYAKDGNIYYDDNEYGRIRIVATSTLIPCGSILRINVPEYDNMYVIVLDRGVSSGIVDLLKESEVSASPVRTLNNVVFDIVRYGY